MPRRRMKTRWVVLGTGLVGLVGAWCLPCPGQQIYRNGFESNHTSWAKGSADVEYVEDAHAMVEQGRPSSGPRAEYLKVTAKQGSYLYYQFPTKRAPITDELSVGLWLKSKRPGAQLLARVVLPHERDPYSYDDRLTALLRGDAYRLTDRWQHLEIGRPVILAQKQQQLMQAQLGRAVDFTDAYIDLLILNVYAGPGENEVWIDDLEMGPVLDDPVRAPGPQAGKTPGATASLPHGSGQAAVVEYNGSHLLVNGKRFFFRGIRHTDTPLAALRNAGFNTVWLDAGAPPALVQRAAELGFRLVPALPAGDEGHLVSTEGLRQDVLRFPESGEVLFWHLGDSLTHREKDMAAVARSAQMVRSLDATRPVAVDAADGLGPYARSVSLLGVHRYPFMTSLELSQYRTLLEQRRILAWQGQPNAFLWTWVQTHAPEWYTTLVYDRPPTAAFPEPIGPQPEQIRLMAYSALAAGYRGLAYSSDRFLADSHQGRDRLLGVALVNQEMEMLEPLLVTPEDPPRWINTSIPEVKAAVFRGPKGVFLLPIWCGRGAQYVPGQAAVNKLTIVVPHLPQDVQGWEVTPGEVRGLRLKRVVGGTEVTVGEFGLTTAVVLTCDLKLVTRLQEVCHDQRQIAAQWTYLAAQEELKKVLAVERELEQQGHKLPDGAQLLQDAENRLRLAKEHWDNRLFGEAYREAQRALRPVRILMRAQWDKATDAKLLDVPVASPYAVSFYTLPRHWQLMDQVRSAATGGNQLVGGDFEVAAAQAQSNWTLEDRTLDPVELRAERVGADTSPGDKRKGPQVEPKEGKQCLKLEVKAKDSALVPAALEGTYLAVSSPPVRLQPGTLVKVSGWVHVPSGITGSVDGALLFDSVGGENLAVRLTQTTPWKKFTLYRRVPASGTISMTAALTGIGTAYFDDLRIEPLVPSTTP